LHLLNVRARDLSIHAEQPGDFLNWAFRQLDQGENDAGLHQGLAHTTFLPRQLFGEYVRQRLFEAVAKRKDVAFEVIAGAATGCTRDGHRFRVQFDRAAPLKADIVILATAYGEQGHSTTGALAPSKAPPLSDLPARSRRHCHRHFPARSIAEGACPSGRGAAPGGPAAVQAHVAAGERRAHRLRGRRGA
jgi:hypothetical protein